MLKKGDVVVKLAGRDFGVCAVVDKKENRLLVIGPSVRKRWVNPDHLEPLGKTVDAALPEEDVVKKLVEVEKKFKNHEEDFLAMTSLKAKLGR